MSDEKLRRIEREADRDPKELERLLAEYLRAGRNDDAANIARGYLETNPADAEKRRIVAKTNPYAWTGIVSYQDAGEHPEPILQVREGQENYTVALPGAQENATIRDIAFAGKTLTIILSGPSPTNLQRRGDQQITITPKTYQTTSAPQIIRSLYAAHHTNKTGINYINSQTPFPLTDRLGGIIFENLTESDGRYDLQSGSISTRFPQGRAQFEGTRGTDWLFEDNQLHFYDSVNQRFKPSQSDTSSVNAVRNPFSRGTRYIPETSRLARNINRAQDKYHLAALFAGCSRLAVEVPITILNRLRQMRDEQTRTE